jgi:diguanylate cyclase (GGDEF)-like protein
MTDLDHFKAKNDNYGHQAGDAILAEAAKRMKASLRQQDIIGRYGGEEFIIFLSGASRAEALEVGERIRKRVDQSPVNVKGQQLVQTVSVGIACFPDDGQTTESLIHRADSCLYVAKKGGRNMVVDASSTESLAVKSGTGSRLRA